MDILLDIEPYALKEGPVGFQTSTFWMVYQSLGCWEHKKDVKMLNIYEIIGRYTVSLT